MNDELLISHGYTDTRLCLGCAQAKLSIVSPDGLQVTQLDVEDLRKLAVKALELTTYLSD